MLMKECVETWKVLADQDNKDEEIDRNQYEFCKMFKMWKKPHIAVAVLKLLWKATGFSTT